MCPTTLTLCVAGSNMLTRTIGRKAMSFTRCRAWRTCITLYCVNKFPSNRRLDIELVQAGIVPESRLRCNHIWVSAVKSPRLEGIVPESWQSSRKSRSSDRIWPNVDGIGPTIVGMLDRKSPVKAVSCPKFAGINPRNWLLDASNRVRLVIAPSSVGSVPVKLLLEIQSVLATRKRPSVVGMVPVSLLLCNPSQVK